MNTPIARLYVLVVVLFALLVAFTSRWTVFEADALRDNALNRRPVLEEQKIRRGLIRAADGTLLARSLARPDGTYTRRYPQGELFGHITGFSYTVLGRTGLERARNDELTGRRDDVTTVVDQLLGDKREGDDVITGLDPGAQRAAVQALNGRKGSVVALDPDTGAVQAMVANPGYDPGRAADPQRFKGVSTFNRATQSGYPPGSTFKVVTAIAAVDSGNFEPASIVSGENDKPISGVPLRNFGGQDFGRVDLTLALTKSVNTAWAAVAESLGGETMQRYMDRLGFGADPPLDYPDAQMRPSGQYRNGRIISASSRFTDVGRMAIGQDKLAVTPLQMAMVAAAVANGGQLMKPQFTDKVVDRDGRTVEDVEPEVMSDVMSADSAAKVTEMMANVVREGSGTAAALQGIEVAGKTGTAEGSGGCPQNQVWFIGFAPVRNPRTAVAATVECDPGTGGVVAAPIAKQVMESLLR